MQIWDRGPERFDELARRVETALARLRGGIVIVVLGREQFIDDRQVAPIPASVVELTDGRLQLVAHLAAPVGRQEATVTDGSRQYSRRRAPSPFPTSRPTPESTLLSAFPASHSCLGPDGPASISGGNVPQVRFLPGALTPRAPCGNRMVEPSEMCEKGRFGGKVLASNLARPGKRRPLRMLTGPSGPG